MTALRGALLAGLLAAWPRAAAACAVCMTGREDDTNQAFLLGTILLSVLPLALIGGIVWWVRRSAQAQARPDAEAPVSPAPRTYRTASDRPIRSRAGTTRPAPSRSRG